MHPQPWERCSCIWCMGICRSLPPLRLSPPRSPPPHYPIPPSPPPARRGAPLSSSPSCADVCWLLSSPSCSGRWYACAGVRWLLCSCAETQPSGSKMFTLSWSLTFLSHHAVSFCSNVSQHVHCTVFTWSCSLLSVLPCKYATVLKYKIHSPLGSWVPWGTAPCMA